MGDILNWTNTIQNCILVHQSIYNSGVKYNISPKIKANQNFNKFKFHFKYFLINRTFYKKYIFSASRLFINQATILEEIILYKSTMLINLKLVWYSILFTCRKGSNSNQNSFLVLWAPIASWTDGTHRPLSHGEARQNSNWQPQTKRYITHVQPFACRPTFIWLYLILHLAEDISLKYIWIKWVQKSQVGWSFLKSLFPHL